MMRYHPFRAMNTDVLLAAEGEAQAVEQGFRETEELMHQYEQRFTRFSETSELAALNRSSGGWFQASKDLYELVLLAYDCYDDTDGLFDPGILNALERIGYNRSMELVRAGGASSSQRIEDWPRPAPSFGRVEFDPQRKAIRLPEGLRIDLGGIGKGWIAERAARNLAKVTHACVVDAGGDLFALGRPGDQPAWKVAIENPFDPHQDLAVLSIGPGAVATSSVMKRRWQQDGQERHHLIDPRTGLPAQTIWVSVTVVAEQSTGIGLAEAEVLAKAQLIGGPNAASDLVKRHPGVAFIAVDQNGKLWGSENSQKVLYANNQSTEHK